MKSLVFTIFLITGGLSMAAEAEKMKVQLTGGFHAVTEHLIATGNDQNAFVYSVSGAIQLTTAAGEKWNFSIDCLGFDEVGVSQGTVGLGRCSWADADDHKLYVSLQTAGESNIYEINSGTGKWLGASGKITTHFEYLPSPSAGIYLGIDEGDGQLTKPVDKN